MTTIRMNKTQILERLAEQLPIATEHDAAELKTHKADEAAHLKKFREACRQAAKWDYKTAKANEFNPLHPMGDTWSARRGPRCPDSVAARITRLAHLVNISSQERYVLGPDGANSSLFRMITWTPEPMPDLEVC